MIDDLDLSSTIDEVKKSLKKTRSETANMNAVHNIYLSIWGEKMPLSSPSSRTKQYNRL